MTLRNTLGFPKPPAETRVVVAMSGGVDSSVVAASLARDGFDVVGITLQLYDHGAALARKGACCAGRDIHDARRVAAEMGFPHYVLDYESRFREAVVEEFADQYLAGATPIPCIRCNERVKFQDLLATARELEADCLATGHYIQRRDGPAGPELHRAADPGRKPFVGTTGVGCLDNISLYHLFEDESRSWVQAHGGSVVELHAYAVDPGMSETAVREDLLRAFHAFYPELEGAKVLEERYLLHRDCPAFSPGSYAGRPGVPTPHGGIALAGDFVRLPLPSALMERAVASGFLAANNVLAPHGVRPEPIRSIPRRGLLGRRSVETEASRMR